MTQDQKVNNNSTLLANTKGQSLKEHSLAVALYGHLLLRSLKFKSDSEKEINEYLICSALLHDIGKVSTSFQEYIKKQMNETNNLEDIPTDAESLRNKSFIGPFHNEISWAYMAEFIKIESSLKREIIRHSVYWHHPANWDEKNHKLRFQNSQTIFESIESNLSENTNTLLKKMYLFVSDLFSCFCSIYGVKKINSLNFYSSPCKEQIDTRQYPGFFSHKTNKTAENAKKQLCLNLLLEADRAVSRWTNNELNFFLKQISKSKHPISNWAFDESIEFFEPWSKSVSCFKKMKAFSVSENISRGSRSEEQFNLAKKMSDKKLSVCGVDPAGGKTSIALYWWSKSNNDYPLMIVLPRQHQVTGLFKSLEKDSKRVFNLTNIKIEGVFNGKRQIANWSPKDKEDLLISNINIMVFDRFLSPYYKRNQSSEFIKMLSSHLVLDEFHEFKNIPKMIPSLKEILHIRSWLDSGVKTLMLSGTPEPALLNLFNVENSNIFNRKKLSPRKKHKFKLSTKEKAPTHILIPDCLYSFLRVESCQEFFALFYKKYQDKIKLIHSYFTSKDKKEKLEDILQEHGSADSFVSDKSVITAKMLQSSYNLSFKKAVLEFSQPDIDCQTAGRVNRFENKQDAEIFFFDNEETEKFFNEKHGAGFKEIHKNWKEYLLNFIKTNKEHTVSVRDLMELYDSFWANKNNITKAECVLNKQQEKAIEELNKYIPKRFTIKTEKNSFSSLNSLFRGESRFLSACVVNDKGDPTEPYQLYGEYLLGEGREWLIKKTIKAMEICLKTNSACEKANKIKENIFEYKKYIIKSAPQSLGFKEERPLLLSHYNQDINTVFSTELADEDNKTDHRVYNKIFGLVKESVLKNEQ